MGLNGLLGSNDGFSSNFGGVAAAGVWMIVSVILAIIGGIVLYFVVFTKQNEHKFTGTMAWIYDFFTFKKMLLETLLKILYMIVAIYITLSSFSLISISFIGFLLQLTLGNLLARIGFEFSLLLLTICKNTTEINDKLSKSKKIIFLFYLLFEFNLRTLVKVSLFTFWFSTSLFFIRNVFFLLLRTSCSNSSIFLYASLYSGRLYFRNLFLNSPFRLLISWRAKSMFSSTVLILQILLLSSKL